MGIDIADLKLMRMEQMVAKLMAKQTELRDWEIVIIVFTALNSLAIVAAALFYLWQKQKVANTPPPPMDVENVAEAKTVGGKRAAKPPPSVTEESEVAGEDGIEDDSEDEDEDEDQVEVHDDFDRLSPHR